MADVFKYLFGTAKAAPAATPKVSPMGNAGVMGGAVYGGYLASEESSPELRGTKKYETYSEIMANTTIVAAGVRYFLNLAAKSEWSFAKSDADTDGRYAELAEEIFKHDPATPWHRIVRRAAMYRFYGFSVQEWQAFRRKDGVISLYDVSPRAQKTITKWDVDPTGLVRGMIQTSPQTAQELYIPRWKTLYVVDDTIQDTPEGVGLFRHLALAAKRLKRFEQLEGFGFETDLRGIPVGRGPFTQLAEMEKAGEISSSQRSSIEAPMRSFIENHIRGPKLGMLLDSQPYQSQDEAATPSSIRQWDVELLKSGSTSLPETAAAIQRINREMARVLGVEQLLLGETSSGSYSLSQNKTQSFFMLVDATLKELQETVKRDLLTQIWKLNGWSADLIPDISSDTVRFRDVTEITASLRDMAQAGALLAPDDPAIMEIRDYMGLSRPVSVQTEALDASLQPASPAFNPGNNEA